MQMSALFDEKNFRFFEFMVHLHGQGGRWSNFRDLVRASFMDSH